MRKTIITVVLSVLASFGIARAFDGTVWSR